MKYIKIYNEDKNNNFSHRYVGKLYFIDDDCGMESFTDHTLFIWKFIDIMDEDDDDRLLLSKLYHWNSMEGMVDSTDDWAQYTLSPSAFNIIYESDDFDDIYEHFLMLVESQKYNL